MRGVSPAGGSGGGTLLLVFFAFRGATVRLSFPAHAVDQRTAGKETTVIKLSPRCAMFLNN
ncbi:hypothetical protein KCP71_15660 [Salmonella enterica subsp. enterica]|nr:hypothetical protein KCP71_15660 [Salmonella enterica subsp. enterica]